MTTKVKLLEAAGYGADGSWSLEKIQRLFGEGRTWRVMALSLETGVEEGTLVTLVLLRRHGFTRQGLEWGWNPILRDIEQAKEATRG